MNVCAVYGCANSLTPNPDPGIQYYNFPKHPAFVQQWITACWRSDTIDINNAQVCSIHFEDNSYSSEFKLVDYLGHCTRILKYDAVPTLYIPNPNHHIVLKNTVEKQTIALHINHTVNQSDIKDLVIYDVQDVTFDTNASHQQGLIPINTEFLSVTIPRHDDVPVEEDNNYDIQQLQNLKNENQILKQSVLEVENSISSLENQISSKTKSLEAKDEQLKGVMRKYDILRRTHMPLSTQRNILSKVFSESQLRILSGSKKIYWSNDDMAIGYTIRNLSNKRLYMYLTKNLNIPLPALSSVRRWMTLKRLESPKEEIKDIQIKEEEIS